MRKTIYPTYRIKQYFQILHALCNETQAKITGLKCNHLRREHFRSEILKLSVKNQTRHFRLWYASRCKALLTVETYCRQIRCYPDSADAAVSVRDSASFDELGCKFKLTSSSDRSPSSSSERTSSSLYLLYGDRRQPWARYEFSLPHAASNKPRYGGDGFSGLVKYSGWYWTAT